MITALSGEFPYYDFGRSGISDSYAKLLRHKLQQDGLNRVHKENGLKGISLTAKGLEKLKEKYPGRFDYVSEKSRTELSRRYRKQSFALTYCSLMNSKIEFLPDRKPFIFARSRSQPYSVSSPLLKTSMLSDEPVFYSSVEIKYELEDLVQQIREAFGESNPGYKMINDGFDSDGAPVLNACHLDIIRLLRFKRGLLTNGIPGRILCYDFQMEFIAKLMKPAKVHINHIKIKDAEEMIKNEKI